MAILRKEEPQQPSAPPQKSKHKSGEIIALLGQGSEFEGKLTFKGTVRIDGKFKGEVFSDSTLIIGEGADIKGKISVGSVIIHGNIIGDIMAKELIELHNPAKVYGKLITPNLAIERGVIFQGECQMENIDKHQSRPGGNIPEPTEKKIISSHDKDKPSAADKPVDIGED